MEKKVWKLIQKTCEEGWERYGMELVGGVSHQGSPQMISISMGSFYFPAYHTRIDFYPEILTFKEGIQEVQNLLFDKVRELAFLRDEREH